MAVAPLPLVKHLHPCASLPPLTLNLKKCQLGTSFFGGKPFQLQKPSRMASRRRERMQAVASLGGLLGGIFKGTDTGESTRQQYALTVSVINGLEAQMSSLSDSELREKTRLFQERAKQGEALDSLLPEAFAVVREASKRVLGFRPFDVQLIGGILAWFFIRGK